MSGDGKQVYVLLPIGKTRAIRKLNRRCTLPEFKTILELKTGFPDGTYTIQYGCKTISEKALILFKDEINNGTVLRICEKPELQNVITAIKSKDFNTIFKSCLNDEKALDIGKAFIASCICANLGLKTVLLKLLSKDGSIFEARTIHGRNIAHIIAASEQQAADSLHKVLLLAHKHGADLLFPDSNKKTPTNIAYAHNNNDCDKVIRNFVFYKRTGSSRGTPQKLLDFRPPPAIKEKTKLTKLGNIKLEGQFFRNKSISSIGSLYSKSNRYSEAVSSGYHTDDEFRDSRQTITAAEIEKPKDDDGAVEDETRAQFEANDVLTDPENIENGDEDVSKVSAAGQRKRVKFKKRVQSAPANTDCGRRDASSSDKDNKHAKCLISRKPFLAYRTVPEDELRPLVVEFVEYPAMRQLGLDQKSHDLMVLGKLNDRCSSSGVSSRSNSPYQQLDITDDESMISGAEGDLNLSFRSAVPDLQHSWRASKPSTANTPQDEKRKVLEKKKEMLEKYTNPASITSRAQSAKYYRASYHARTEQERIYSIIPPAKPVTADCRYRSWKTWLQEKYAAEDERLRQKGRSDMHVTQMSSLIKQVACHNAYREWLRRKDEEAENAQRSSYKSDSDSDDEDERTAKASAWAAKYLKNFQQESELTYNKWKENKASQFKQLDEKTIRRRRGEPEPVKPFGRLNIFRLGCTRQGDIEPEDYHSYIRAYQKWRSRKMKYEEWKRKRSYYDNATRSSNDSNDASIVTRQQSARELKEMRKVMYLEGFSYNQWLGQIDREEKFAKQQTEEESDEQSDSEYDY